MDCDRLFQIVSIFILVILFYSHLSLIYEQNLTHIETLLPNAVCGLNSFNSSNTIITVIKENIFHLQYFEIEHNEYVMTLKIICI